MQANFLGLLKSNVGPCVVSLISDNIRVTANEVWQLKRKIHSKYFPFVHILHWLEHLWTHALIRKPILHGHVFTTVLNCPLQVKLKHINLKSMFKSNAGAIRARRHAFSLVISAWHYQLLPDGWQWAQSGQLWGGGHTWGNSELIWKCLMKTNAACDTLKCCIHYGDISEGISPRRNEFITIVIAPCLLTRDKAFKASWQVIQRVKWPGITPIICTWWMRLLFTCYPLGLNGAIIPVTIYWYV